LISGFGQLEGYRGPYSDRPAFDIVAEAMSGIMNLVGFADKPPSWTIYGMADIYSGMVTAYGIMQALFMRERTGRGQIVDSSMLDNMLSLNESMVTLFSTVGQSPQRGVAKNAYPRGAYQTRNGYVAINVPDDIGWSRLCDVIGRSDLTTDARTRGGSERAANADFVTSVLEQWLGKRDRDEVVDRLNAAGVPTGPIHDAEDVFADPQVAARGMLMPVDDPDVGEHVFARTPVHLSTAPELPRRASPRLGAHTREILGDSLGYSGGEIDDLAARGVIQLESERG